jgi:outer membrane protein TolC
MWKSSDIRSKAVAERVKISRSELVLQALNASLEEQRALLHSSWTAVLMVERQKYVDKITERFDIGAGTIYDVAKAKAKLAEASSANRFNQQKHQSAQLLKSQFGLADNFRLPPLIVELNKIDKDIDQHPVIKEAKYYLDSAQLETSASSAMALPRFSLEANTSRRDINGYSNVINDNSVLLTMTYNFMAGGADMAKKDQAAARFGQARADYESRQLKLRVELDRSLREYKAHLGSMNDSRELLVAFNNMFLAQKELFELQRGSLTELANTEDDLSQATKNYINSWIDYSISAYRLHHANGSLLPLVGLYTTVSD